MKDFYKHKMDMKNKKTLTQEPINLSDPERVIIAKEISNSTKPAYEKLYSLFYTEFEDLRIFSVVFDEKKNILAFEIDRNTWETTKTFVDFDDQTIELLETQISEFFDTNRFIFEGKPIDPFTFFNNSSPETDYDDIIEELSDKEVIRVPELKNKAKKAIKSKVN